MKLYWWRMSPTWSGEAAEHLRGDAPRNFGDELNKIIADRLGLNYGWAPPSESELVVSGSILEHLPTSWAGSVCGAGKLLENSRINLSEARVFALRGKLTAAGCTGLKGTPVLGDPGLLMPRWLRQPTARYDLGVIPHWSDKTLYQRFSYGHFIDPTQSPDKVIHEIAACRRVISSGLHGLIIADAYGIPRQAERGPHMDNPKEGGDFKFRDYASLYDTDPHWGEMWSAPRARVEQIQNDLADALTAAAGVDPSRESRASPQVSLLVPFRDDGEHRSQVWRWLRSYWRSTFPQAEIVQGHDDSVPFNKANAVNRAAEMARGRILVVLDADAYLDAQKLQDCANTIDQALSKRQRAWYMPYNEMFRLNQQATMNLLKTKPSEPVPLPPPPDWCEKLSVNNRSDGHKYGALATMMPKEAFHLVRGLDPRFKGWGGEDAAFLKALDTLYCQHEVAQADAVHFWHQRIGANFQSRRWVGQRWDDANSRLSQMYTRASANEAAMRGLVDGSSGG